MTKARPSHRPAGTCCSIHITVDIQSMLIGANVYSIHCTCSCAKRPVISTVLRMRYVLNCLIVNWNGNQNSEHLTPRARGTVPFTKLRFEWWIFVDDMHYCFSGFSLGSPWCFYIVRDINVTSTIILFAYCLEALLHILRHSPCLKSHGFACYPHGLLLLLLYTFVDAPYVDVWRSNRRSGRYSLLVTQSSISQQLLCVHCTCLGVCVELLCLVFIIAVHLGNKKIVYPFSPLT